MPPFPSCHCAEEEVASSGRAASGYRRPAKRSRKGRGVGVAVSGRRAALHSGDGPSPGRCVKDACTERKHLKIDLHRSLLCDDEAGPPASSPSSSNGRSGPETCGRIAAPCLSHIPKWNASPDWNTAPGVNRAYLAGCTRPWPPFGPSVTVTVTVTFGRSGRSGGGTRRRSAIPPDGARRGDGPWVLCGSGDSH